MEDPIPPLPDRPEVVDQAQKLTALVLKKITDDPQKTLAEALGEINMETDPEFDPSLTDAERTRVGELYEQELNTKLAEARAELHEKIEVNKVLLDGHLIKALLAPGGLDALVARTVLFESVNDTTSPQKLSSPRREEFAMLVAREYIQQQAVTNKRPPNDAKITTDHEKQDIAKVTKFFTNPDPTLMRLLRSTIRDAYLEDRKKRTNTVSDALAAKVPAAVARGEDLRELWHQQMLTTDPDIEPASIAVATFAKVKSEDADSIVPFGAIVIEQNIQEHITPTDRTVDEALAKVFQKIPELKMNESEIRERYKMKREERIGSAMRNIETSAAGKTSTDARDAIQNEIAKLPKDVALAVKTKIFKVLPPEQQVEYGVVVLQGLAQSYMTEGMALEAACDEALSADLKDFDLTLRDDLKAAYSEERKKQTQHRLTTFGVMLEMHYGKDAKRGLEDFMPKVPFDIYDLVAAELRKLPNIVHGGAGITGVGGETNFDEIVQRVKPKPVPRPKPAPAPGGGAKPPEGGPKIEGVGVLEYGVIENPKSKRVRVLLHIDDNEIAGTEIDPPLFIQDLLRGGDNTKKSVLELANMIIRVIEAAFQSLRYKNEAVKILNLSKTMQEEIGKISADLLSKFPDTTTEIMDKYNDIFPPTFKEEFTKQPEALTDKKFALWKRTVLPKIAHKFITQLWSGADEATTDNALRKKILDNVKGQGGKNAGVEENLKSIVQRIREARVKKEREAEEVESEGPEARAEAAPPSYLEKGKEKILYDGYYDWTIKEFWGGPPATHARLERIDEDGLIDELPVTIKSLESENVELREGYLIQGREKLEGGGPFEDGWKIASITQEGADKLVVLEKEMKDAAGVVTKITSEAFHIEQLRSVNLPFQPKDEVRIKGTTGLTTHKVVGLDRERGLYAVVPRTVSDADMVKPEARKSWIDIGKLSAANPEKIWRPGVRRPEPVVDTPPTLTAEQLRRKTEIEINKGAAAGTVALLLAQYKESCTKAHKPPMDDKLVLPIIKKRVLEQMNKAREKVGKTAFTEAEIFPPEPVTPEPAPAAPAAGAPGGAH